jgi:RyR domain
MKNTTSLHEACARAAHEANRAYCLATGDTSQPSWDDAPEWQKSSARNGVVGALTGNTPEQSHESWLAEKRATGWKWGPIKNPAAKEHPCMVPYAELPPLQRAKDALFVTTVRAMAQALESVE